MLNAQAKLALGIVGIIVINIVLFGPIGENTLGLGRSIPILPVIILANIVWIFLFRKSTDAKIPKILIITSFILLVLVSVVFLYVGWSLFERSASEFGR